ncbi:MAG TPA: hypothetical protein VFU90_10735, partial [Candidatus Tumulicola sp.]|nr:hypothetical protein [Candidatus Tumulicola sp.]
RRLIGLLSASVLALGSALVPTPVDAEMAGGGGNVDPASGTVSVHIHTESGGDDVVVDLSGHSRTQLVDFSIVRVPAQNGSEDGLCLAGRKPDGTPQLGFNYHQVGRSHIDGSVVYDEYVCVPFTNPGDTPSPPPSPQLPTIEDAWRAANLPTPVINLDPATRGITGLDTRLWTDAPQTIRISAEAGGYTITGNATVTGYELAIDDQPPITVGDPGTNDRPIAHYTFETRGLHHIRVGIVWHGDAQMTGPDLLRPIGVMSIGDATITATRDYQVNEIRSVLQPG